MDAVWDRVDGELRRRRKSWAWLARQLGYEPARVGNWKARGIPAEQHARIAVALGQSVDWVAGLTEEMRPPVEALSAMAVRLGQEFDQITDLRAQLDAFAQCVAIITRARG